LMICVLNALLISLPVHHPHVQKHLHLSCTATQAQSDCLPIDHQSITLISQVLFPTGVLHWSGKKRQKRLVGVKPILLSLKSWLILA
jgi:hypothetical protein